MDCFSSIAKNRQSLFLSATVGGKTNEILKNFVNDPVTVSVKKQETSNNVEQDIIRLTGGRAKIDVLHDLIISLGLKKHDFRRPNEMGNGNGFQALIARGFKQPLYR